MNILYYIYIIIIVSGESSYLRTQENKAAIAGEINSLHHHHNDNSSIPDCFPPS